MVFPCRVTTELSSLVASSTISLLGDFLRSSMAVLKSFFTADLLQSHTLLVSLLLCQVAPVTCHGPAQPWNSLDKYTSGHVLVCAVGISHDCSALPRSSAGTSPLSCCSVYLYQICVEKRLISCTTTRPIANPAFEVTESSRQPKWQDEHRLATTVQLGEPSCDCPAGSPGVGSRGFARR